MHPLPVPGSHEYVMRTAGSVDQSVAPETTASRSQDRLKFQSPHGHRSGQSTPRNTEMSSKFVLFSGVMYIVDMIWNNIAIKTMLSRYIFNIFQLHVHYIGMMIYVDNIIVLMFISRIDNCDWAHMWT